MGKTKLPEGLFGLPWNADLVHQVVVSMQSSARRGTAHAKTRGEVSGTGKKPWQQKGTGRARHGSRRSPIWVGGGVAHGPRKDKNYDRKVNRKMKDKALLTILSSKYKNGEVLFVDKKRNQNSV
jgi:large subunit ribosomal protein L4